MWLHRHMLFNRIYISRRVCRFTRTERRLLWLLRVHNSPHAGFPVVVSTITTTLVSCADRIHEQLWRGMGPVSVEMYAM